MTMWLGFCSFDQVLTEEEKGSTEGLEDEDWDRALSVERFRDIITESGTNGADKMGRSYNEKDFECKYSCFWTTTEKNPGVFLRRNLCAYYMPRLPLQHLIQSDIHLTLQSEVHHLTIELPQVDK